MAKVSILVAVYNAGDFLAKCLDSLLAQTMPDFQAVCIDDGSTDGSLQVLESYVRRDARIEVVALPENHGQAYATNVGLRHATGRYIAFLDVDDWLSEDALQLAVEQFEQHPATGCVLFEVENVYPDHSERYPLPHFQQLTGEQAFRMSLDWQIHGIYMARRELYERYPYDDTCRTYSNDNTTRMHFMASEEVRRCQGVYYYLQHPASMTHQVSVRHFDFLRANESMKRQLQQAGVAEDIMCQWETTRLLVLVDCYMFYHCHGRQLSAEERRYGLEEMHRVWGNLERHRLSPRTARKFGYRPMPRWWLFRLQEWLYFTMRAPLGKNK